MPPTTPKNPGRKSKEAEATPVEAKAKQVTTIAVSTAFAEALKEVAKDLGGSVADLCDSEFLGHMQQRAADVLRKRLERITPAKD